MKFLQRLLKYLKIWLNTDLKIILLDHQNNYVERLSVDNTAKSFDILTVLILHNYFECSNNIVFRFVSS